MPGKPIGAISSVEPALRVAGFGFLFWAALLLAIDPDLIFGQANGWLPAVENDARRILAASVLGAGLAMVQSLMVTRFPVESARRLSHLAVHAGACLGLSLAVIVISHAGVALVVPPDSPRLGQPLGQEIADNLILMSLALAAFCVGLHLARKRGEGVRTAAPDAALRIPVKTRDGVLVLEAASIDWIEAQGNYAALHIGEKTHLVRETLAQLSARLGTDSFVRIHRGAIVNVARLKRIEPLGSGDATVELADGTELRASRTFAGALRERISPSPSSPSRGSS